VRFSETGHIKGISSELATSDNSPMAALISRSALLTAMPNIPSTALQQVGDLLRRGRLVHGLAVAEQRHRGEVIEVAAAQVVAWPSVAR
jgi:hypothetical protein